MFGLGPATKIYVAVGAVDMRRTRSSGGGARVGMP